MRLTTPYGSALGDAERQIWNLTAVCSIAAGLIHVSAAADHSDLPLMMAGFELVAILQVALGGLILWRRPRSPLLAGGLALMIASVVLWLLSRTVGLSFIVDGTHTEPVGFRDGVTVVFELVAIGGLLHLSRVQGRSAAPREASSSRLDAPALGALGTVALALFVGALGAGGHGHVHDQVTGLHALGAAGEAHAGAGSAEHRGGSGTQGHAGTQGHDRDRAAGGHGGSHPGGSDQGGHTALAHDATGDHANDSQLAVAVHAHGAPAVAGGPVVHDHSGAGGNASGSDAGGGHGHATGGGEPAGGGSGGHPTGGGHGSHPPGGGAGYGGDSGSGPQPPPPTQPGDGGPLPSEVTEPLDPLVP